MFFFIFWRGGGEGNGIFRKMVILVYYYLAKLNCSDRKCLQHNASKE